jgi:hypothetical protein
VFGFEGKNRILTAMGFLYYSCKEVFVPQPELTYTIVGSALAALVAIPVIACICTGCRQRLKKRPDDRMDDSALGGRLNAHTVRVHCDPA